MGSSGKKVEKRFENGKIEWKNIEDLRNFSEVITDVQTFENVVFKKTLSLKGLKDLKGQESTRITRIMDTNSKALYKIEKGLKSKSLRVKKN